MVVRSLCKARADVSFGAPALNHGGAQYVDGRRGILRPERRLKAEDPVAAKEGSVLARNSFPLKVL